MPTLKGRHPLRRHRLGRFHHLLTAVATLARVFTKALATFQGNTQSLGPPDVGAVCTCEASSPFVFLLPLDPDSSQL